MGPKPPGRLLRTEAAALGGLVLWMLPAGFVAFLTIANSWGEHASEPYVVFPVLLSGAWGTMALVVRGALRGLHDSAAGATAGRLLALGLASSGALLILGWLWAEGIASRTSTDGVWGAIAGLVGLTFIGVPVLARAWALSAGAAPSAAPRQRTGSR